MWEYTRSHYGGFDMAVTAKIAKKNQVKQLAGLGAKHADKMGREADRAVDIKAGKKVGPAEKSDETKAAKFSRLASKRVTTALQKIGLIGNLAGTGYEYTPEQVAKLQALLTDQVKATMGRFNKSAVTKSDAIVI